jgi:hypothetical protein
MLNQRVLAGLLAVPTVMTTIAVNAPSSYATYGGSIYSDGTGNLLLSIPLRRNIISDSNSFFAANQNLPVLNLGNSTFYILSTKLTSVSNNNIGIKARWLLGNLQGESPDIICFYRGNYRGEWKLLCPLPGIARKSLGKGYIPTK